MNWIELGAWEARNALRELIPRRWVRRSLVAFWALAELVFCGLALFIPLPSERAVDLGVLTGFLALNLMLASGLAALSFSRLVDAPRKLELVAVSPLGSTRAVWLLLAPALVAGCLPITSLLLPFALIVVRRAPLTALAMAASAFVILAWGLAFAVAAASALVGRLGRARAAAALRLWGALLPLGLLLAFKPVVRAEAPRSVTLALLIGSVFLLPIVWPRVASGFFERLSGPTRWVPRAREPRWGSPGWGRELWRTLAVRMLLAPVAPVLIAAWRPEALPAVLGLALVFAVMVPLGQLLGAEWETPGRLRLAPFGSGYRLRLIGAVGGVALVLVLAMAALLGWGRWNWLATVAVASALVLPVCLIQQRLLRGAGQVLVSLIAVMATVFWN